MAAIHDTYGGRFRQAVYISDAPPDQHTAASAPLQRLIVDVFDQPSGPVLLSALLHPKHPLQPGLALNGSIVPPPELERASPVLRNIFDRAHGVPWHLAQFKYMLGLAEAKRRFGGAQWCLLVDSDTFVFPSRLLRYTRAAERQHNRSVAFGFTRKAGLGGVQFGFFLGGAGVLLSAASLRRMDLVRPFASHDQAAGSHSCAGELHGTGAQ